MCLSRYTPDELDRLIWEMAARKKLIVERVPLYDRDTLVELEDEK